LKIKKERRKMKRNGKKWLMKIHNLILFCFISWLSKRGKVSEKDRKPRSISQQFFERSLHLRWNVFQKERQPKNIKIREKKNLSYCRWFYKIKNHKNYLVWNAFSYITLAKWIKLKKREAGRTWKVQKSA
jgi:hypothetical protein